jgi:YVTN family beta-propeller protein
MHTLAPESGGDAFHSGGRQFETQNDPDWLTLAEWVRGAETPPPPPAPAASLIFITNSAGDTVDVIDPATNKIVQVIRGVETPHGVSFSPDGARVYISNETERALDVVDRRSGAMLKKIPLTGRPNNLAVTKDGGRVLIGIWETPGAVDIVDASSLERVRSIPLKDSVHNVYVTPDGKYAVSGSIEGKVLTIIDLRSEKVVAEVKFDSGVRPMTFETNPDGSTSRIFVQLSRFNGFAVVDFTNRAEAARIKFPAQPGGFGIAEGRLDTPSHGIGVTPDGTSLWVNSTVANAVFAYSLPDLKLIGHVDLPLVHPLGRTSTGAVPEWITFTPDSRLLYVSNSAARAVSVIDTKTIKQIALVPVGEVPKRNNTLVIH